MSLVINHSIPNDYKTYIHRVGRTARAGRGGTAVSLVSQYEIGLVKSIEENINCKLKDYNISGECRMEERILFTRMNCLSILRTFEFCCR